MIMCTSQFEGNSGPKRPPATMIRPPPRNRGVHIIAVQDGFLQCSLDHIVIEWSAGFPEK